MADRVLWPDTNVTRQTGKFLELSRIAGSKGVPLAVHAQVFLETRRHRQCDQASKGRPFDATKFDGVFRQVNDARTRSLRFHDLVVDFERARRWSERLFTRHPTDDAWQAEKRRALHAAMELAPGGRNVPMTADWWIALSLEELPDAYVVTADTGPEWAMLRDTRRVLSHTEAIAWLETLPDLDPAS